jgi:hypothetical protein
VSSHLRPQGDKKDSIMITTERYQFMVLRFDTKAGVLRTTANGDLRVSGECACS